MPTSIPLELRLRVVAAVIEDGDTYEQAADRFKVGRASVNRWLALARRGELAPKRHTNGHKHTIRGEREDWLRELLQECPEDTLPEYCDRFDERHGIRVSSATMGRAIRRLGYTRKKRPSKRKNVTRNESKN